MGTTDLINILTKPGIGYSINIEKALDTSRGNYEYRFITTISTQKSSNENPPYISIGTGYTLEEALSNLLADALTSHIFSRAYPSNDVQEESDSDKVDKPT